MLTFSALNECSSKIKQESITIFTSKDAVLMINARISIVDELILTLKCELDTHAIYCSRLPFIREANRKRSLRFIMRGHQERIEILTFAIQHLQNFPRESVRLNQKFFRVDSCSEIEHLRVIEKAESMTLRQYVSITRMSRKSAALKQLFNQQKNSFESARTLRKNCAKK